MALGKPLGCIWGPSEASLGGLWELWEVSDDLWGTFLGSLEGFWGASGGLWEPRAESLGSICHAASGWLVGWLAGKVT